MRQTPVKLGDITRGRRVVLFAVPGPFTPGCTKAHAPGFISSAEKLRARGIEGVYCISAADGEEEDPDDRPPRLCGCYPCRSV